jgi:hypothetical protein
MEYKETSEKQDELKKRREAEVEQQQARVGLFPVPR